LKVCRVTHNSGACFGLQFGKQAGLFLVGRIEDVETLRLVCITVEQLSADYKKERVNKEIRR